MAKKTTKATAGVVDQLRDAIRNSGQSLSELSKTSGVDPGRLSRFMRGERTLTLPAVEAICRTLRLRLTPEGGPGIAGDAPRPEEAPTGEAEKPRRRRKEG
jgi:transcriptional regulator with XRE-family HTH domain